MTEIWRFSEERYRAELIRAGIPLLDVTDPGRACGCPPGGCRGHALPPVIRPRAIPREPCPDGFWDVLDEPASLTREQLSALVPDVRPGYCVSCRLGKALPGEQVCAWCKDLRTLTGSVQFAMSAVPDRPEVSAPVQDRPRRASCTCSGAPHMTWCPKYRQHARRAVVYFAIAIAAFAASPHAGLWLLAVAVAFAWAGASAASRAADARRARRLYRRDRDPGRGRPGGRDW
jgi:hypothetical protein